MDGSVVRLQFAGNCKSCPSSAATLELAIKDAIRAAAPEITSIDLVTQADPPNVIPAQSLLARVHTNGQRTASWQPVPAIEELCSGEVGGFAVAGAAVLVCRIGDEFFAYRDHCPTCNRPLAGADLTGTVLRCPHCRAGYDVVHAGLGTADSDDHHMEPIPVLRRDGVPAMAVWQDVAS
jgi:nitrite reductase/ring-hydroxylating ferredoxin subunit